MRTHKVFNLIEQLIEAEIKDVKQKTQQSKFAPAMKDFWDDDLQELARLRKSIGKLKDKYLDRKLPY